MRITTLSILLLFSHFQLSAQLYSTGLVFDDAVYKNARVSAQQNADEFENLPYSASLKQYCPRPGNQLQLNTSPAWATSWSALSILDAQKYHRKDQGEITQNTYSPAYTYFYIRAPEDEKCETGVDLYKALDFLKQNGTKFYDDFLEFCPKGVPDNLLPHNPTGRISDFIKLFDDQKTKQFKINAVKKSIAEAYPVVIGMYCPPSFYSAINFWQPSEKVIDSYPGHALCVIGYDDLKYGGAFEVINSWGSLWGNNGFIWIRYDDFVRFTKYAYEVFSINKDEEGNHQLSGDIDLKLNTGQKIAIEKTADGIYQTKSALKTGTYFRMSAKTNDPAFFYIFGIDESNTFYKLFPYRDDISPALINKSNEITIPGHENYIEIIGDPGNENLCIIYSKEALDFNGLLDNLAKYSGNVAENIDALLPGKFLAPGAIKWNDDAIIFSSADKNKSAIFIQIRIVHI